MPKATRKPITTDRSISSHKPETKEYSVSVSNQAMLYLMVRPNGTKSWLYRYKSPTTGKMQRLSFGTYPDVSLARACELRKTYKELLHNGVDPLTYRQKQKTESINKNNLNFNYFSHEYLDTIQAKWKKNTLDRKANAIALLGEYIGDLPITDISAPKMLEVLLDIENKNLQKNGKPTEKAERCASIASDIFNYAISRGYCTANPAQMVRSQLDKPTYGHRPAIVKPDEFAKLLQDIETLAVKVDSNTISSLRLLPMLFVRNGDLRRMRWLDIDFEENKWRFEPLKGEGKEHMVRHMIVPLPRQALEILQQQYKLTGHTEYVFYSPSAAKNGIISDNTANKHLKELGYKDIHCVHGFRASAKTMLQEQLKYPAVLVEMGLGHITKDQNGTAYGRFEFLDDRTEMMQTWADYLDALRDNQDTTKFKNPVLHSIAKQDPETLLKSLIEQLGADKISAIIKSQAK